MCECFGSVVTYVATAWCTMTCFELCCLIVGEFFFPVYPAERCVLNGKVTLVLIVSVVVMNCHFGVVIGNVNT